MLDPLLAEKLNKLYDWAKGRACAIAFSGGVDSTTLAKALVERQDLLAVPPVGYFAESASSTELEKSEARRVANEIGLELRVVQSTEFDDPKFVENSPKRCYWCKKIRFSALKELAQHELGDPINASIALLDGSNADDSGDYRPGMQAALEVGVESPLLEAGLNKSEIRALADYWKLTVAQKPSTPCLATRIAYNLSITNDLLRKIETAEIAIKKAGASTCRARVDGPTSIRIEVPEAEIERFAQRETRLAIIEQMRDLGFFFISLDMEGFASGKNNRAI